ncbi:MAG: hypothetical protein ACI9CU_001062, partial [Polaribacter sp.]
MTSQGNLHKMHTEFGEPIKYRLKLGDDEILVNDLLGQKISIEFDGRIDCVSCDVRTKKAFGQGFCYPC